MIAAAQAGKLKGYRPEVGAAFQAEDAYQTLAAHLERLAPRLHAADGAMPQPLLTLIENAARIASETTRN